MTLIPIGNAGYVGLSGDRPTTGVTSGSRFTDVHTAEQSYFDGSIWVQAPRSVFSGSQITGVISGNPSFFGTVTFSGAIAINGGVSFVSGAPQVSGIYPASGVYALSGTAGGAEINSGIHTVTSGSSIEGVISGIPVFSELETTEIRPGRIVLASGSPSTRTLPITTQWSGNFAITYAPLSGSTAGTTNYWLYNHDQTEALYFERTTIQSIQSRRLAAGGTIRALAFEVVDSVVPTTIEGMRVDTSGNVELNRSGGTLQFKSGNTSLTKSDTAANSGFFAPLGYITARLGTTAIKIPYFSP
jgi:hypothetical protein